MLTIKINGHEVKIVALSDLAAMDGDVVSLSVADSQLDETDISALAGMDRSLETLDLSRNLICDIGVLACHPNLVNLNLSFNKIFDIGVLVSLIKLKELDLRGNPIDAKNLEMLREKLPNATILSD